MAVGEAASFDAGPVALHAGHKSSLHKKTLCMWGLLGTLFTVGIVCNSITTTRGVRVNTEDLTATAGTVLVDHGKLEQSSWMTTAMAELHKEHQAGITMLAQVRADADKESAGPSKAVKMALADGIAKKLEQLKSTDAGQKFLLQVNDEAKSKPGWVKMIARQAARNMLLDVIHAVKQQVLLDNKPKKRILAAQHDPWESKPAPELKSDKPSKTELSSAQKAKLEKLAGNKDDDVRVVSAVSKEQTKKMLPQEMDKVNSILAEKEGGHEKLAVATQQREGDDTKVKLPMALKVVHRLTQLAATPEGENYIQRVRSKLTGKETPKELDDITFNVAHTMLKQLVGNVQDDVLDPK
jgi:hypothetical protein